MPRVAPRTTVGFEFLYNKAGFHANPVLYELLPNTAFTAGMLAVMDVGAGAQSGKIRPAVAADVVATGAFVGVMAETITAANNPAAGLTFGRVYDHPLNVYRATFVPGVNGVNVGGAAGTTTTLVVPAVNANDNLRGAMIYFYGGAGAPAIRTISGAVAVTNTLSWIAPLDVATDATTRYVLLAASVDVVGVNVGSVGLAVNNDSRRVNVTAPAATAPLNCLAIDPANLWMEVMIRAAAHISSK